MKGRDAPVHALPDRRGRQAESHERARRSTVTDDGSSLDVRGVRKTFEAEGAPVRALRGVDLDRRARASSSR